MPNIQWIFRAMRASAAATSIVHATLSIDPYRPFGLLAAKDRWAFAYRSRPRERDLPNGLSVSR